MRHLTILAHTHTNSRTLIEILNGQSENSIMKATPRLIVAIASREEHTTIQHLGKLRKIALRNGSASLPPALLRRLARNLPIGIRSARDALNALEHIALGDAEARDVDTPINIIVAEPRQRRRGIVLAIREFLQAQQSCHSTPALRPRADIDRHVALIEQNELALRKVKAEAVRSAA